MQVSIHELKNHLSKYLLLLRTSEKIIIITSHHAPVAKLLPIESTTNTKGAKSLMVLPGVTWNGKKPQGGRLMPTIEGKTVTEYVLEDRR